MTIKLNETQLANRVQWIKDLLSGNYLQGEGCLKTFGREDGRAEYCCLGVAGEKIAPKSNKMKIKNGASADYLSRDAAILMGFGKDSTEGSGDQSIAAGWNDESKYMFNRIADLVAYATEHRIRFKDIKRGQVSEGYAVEWLASQ